MIIDIEDFLLSEGWDEVGQMEFKRGKWTLEEARREIDEWRLDDYGNEGHQLMWFKMETKEDYFNLMKLVGE